MTDTISIYFSKGKEELRKRLIKLGEKRDRSVNYLIVQAILEYLERGERSLIPRAGIGCRAVQASDSAPLVEDASMRDSWVNDALALIEQHT